MKSKVYIVPHTHYDAEVFLSREETLQLGFSNLQVALNLFKADPAFTFALDQVCYVEPYLRRHPEEKEFFEKMIEEGRLEITGGMYVMPDMNIPSGESFIRQVLFGRKFFERELGVDVKAGWTLDSFGHHPQTPQLMKKCGFDYDIFQRLMKKGGPSEFYFQGLDGTRLLCHWTPASYAVFHPVPPNIHEFSALVEKKLKYLKLHAVTPHILALEGADLTPPESVLLTMVKEFNKYQAEYELVFAISRDFFNAIGDEKDIPIISQDLNPVFQGCYSARIEVKQMNRELENLMLNWEKIDSLLKQFGHPISEESRDDVWEKVLFNQSHDIICGSHIDKAFYAVMDRYRQAKEEATVCLDRRLRAFVSHIDTRGEGIPVVVFNSLGWERVDTVECSVAYSDPDVYEIEVIDSRGKLVPSDLVNPERFPTGGLKKTGVLFVAQNIPAFGYEVYKILPASEEKAHTELITSHPLNIREDKDVGTIENEYVRISFDLWNGVIFSLYDKASGWEILPEDLRIGNTIVREQDYGNFWQYNGPCKGDAFHPFSDRYPLPDRNSNQADFSHNYLGDGTITTGKTFVQFSISHPFGSGQFSTRVRLYAGIPRVDIHTLIVNNDERVRYRAVIPTSIQRGTITHEIPFGAIERPEGEFPAQNWIDYSDGNKGVSLINRGLPGNNVVDGIMMLSLLKCTALKEGYGEVGGFKKGVPTERGYEKGIMHAFRYSLFPHKGDWRVAKSYLRGWEFNNPLLSVKIEKSEGALPKRMSYVRISKDNVVLSCVKPCGDGMIVRVYEAEGRATVDVQLSFVWDLHEVFETDLVEKNAKKVVLDTRKKLLSFDIGAFEIKTFRLA